MAIAGAAYGASRGLEEIVAERMLRQKLEAEIADREQRMAMEQQRITEGANQNRWERERTDKLDAERSTERQRVNDREDTARRGRANMAGVIGMGLDPATAKREIAFSALNNDTDIPSGVMEAMTPPKVERDPLKDYEERKKIDQRYERPPVLKPERDPIADYEAKKAIDAKYAVNGNGPNLQKAGETRAKILDAAKALRDSTGRDAMTGARGWSYGLGLSGENPLPGTAAASAKARFDTLKSLMTLENLGLLKGAMSDKDLAFIQSAGSALSPGMDDATFAKELDQIIEKFEPTVGATPPPAGGSLGGVTLMWDGTKFVKPGGL